MKENEHRITVRLSKHQDFELDNIAKALKISRAALVRKMIDTTIDNYYKAIENEG